MSEQEILKNNELIAIFMGHTEGQHEEWCGNNILEENPFLDEKEMVSYEPHKDWNRLMPVVEKIESLWIGQSRPRCKIEGTYCQIADDRGYYAKNSKLNKDNQLGGYCYHNKYTKLENTYRMVVEFIEWYNTNKNP